MSIRTYADSAIEQGKLATEQANQIVGNLAGRAAGAVSELRTQAERALPLDTIKSVVEPYVEQARKQVQKYGSTVTDRAEGVLGAVRQTVNSDPRLAKAVATAETVAGTVAVAVQERIVKPVIDRTGIGGKPTSTPAAQAGETTNRKPATTRPATKEATAKPTVATKDATAAKPAVKKAATTSAGTTPTKRATKRTASKPTS